MRCLYGKLSRKIGKDLAGAVVEWTMARRPLEKDRFRLFYQLMKEINGFQGMERIPGKFVKKERNVYIHTSGCIVDRDTYEIRSERPCPSALGGLRLSDMQRAIEYGLSFYPMNEKWILYPHLYNEKMAFPL